MTDKIQMVDLHAQYLKIKSEIDAAVQQVIDSSAFINGPGVDRFAENLAGYLGVKHVIPCANGTDALMMALMVLDLKPDDEVIVPTFGYVAAAEVISFLHLIPVMVDADCGSFNISLDELEQYITSKTKAIIPVHLFGQCCRMEPIMQLSQKYNLYVIEDNAQSLGATYTFSDGKKKKAGAIGDIGCTSFFPAKNLGCFGDGGAVFTDHDELAEKIRMTANHGQSEKYCHKIIGCNSRLDTLQAAILDVKLKYLDAYSEARYAAAQRYTEGLKKIDELELPAEEPFSTHVYNQYTVKVKNGKRDALKACLHEKGIPSAVYYPLPLHKQQAFKGIIRTVSSLDYATQLCGEVLSLPMHTELEPGVQQFIIDEIRCFFEG
ncbi:MAG: DegT/DnrJ/EryC1/StrS family aminotransferase [Candidatus Azobacteroides sp.]|nr:DegT/DnrJ/EryC1/StrS family aminotransferase [Candidatus Azobacteroides sp.]